MAKAPKQRKMYEVRYYTLGGMGRSKGVGFKGRLVELDHARKIVKRLKKFGIHAFQAPILIDALSNPAPVKAAINKFA